MKKWKTGFKVWFQIQLLVPLHQGAPDGARVRVFSGLGRVRARLLGLAGEVDGGRGYVGAEEKRTQRQGRQSREADAGRAAHISLTPYPPNR